MIGLTISVIAICIFLFFSGFAIGYTIAGSKHIQVQHELHEAITKDYKQATDYLINEAIKCANLIKGVR